jgi:hypothetical protein
MFRTRQRVIFVYAFFLLGVIVFPIIGIQSGSKAVSITLISGFITAESVFLGFLSTSIVNKREGLRVCGEPLFNLILLTYGCFFLAVYANFVLAMNSVSNVSSEIPAIGLCIIMLSMWTSAILGITILSALWIGTE